MATSEEILEAGAIQRVLQEARLAAGGNGRLVLALLQAAYLEESIRTAIAEQSSGYQVSAIQAFCGVASRALMDTAGQYAAAETAGEERRARLWGRIHNAQDEAKQLALRLQNRFDTVGLTREATVEDVDGDLDTLVDQPLE